MRPIRLVMQAFGPYAGKETIDFTALGNRTMFVISGKTGSGKTTIFDGISFAIYGKASGEDRNGQDLRSQFAEDSLQTEVTLEFMLRDKAYLVTRSPQQERKKKSGTGVTTLTAKAELFELDPSGEKKLLGSNIREVDEKIKTIMGLDANQFRQILMIPQGEFRKLLTSESKDKEQILQKLFHTELYKQMEERLKEQASDLKKQSEKSKLDRIHLMKEIDASDHEALLMEIKKDEPSEQIVLPLLSTEIERAETKIVSLEADILCKQQARDGMKEEIYRAEEQIKQFSEREFLRVEKEKLENKKNEIEEMNEQIGMAQKAEVLEKQEHFYLKIGQQVKDTRLQIESLENREKQIQEEKSRLQEIYDAELAKAPERDKASSVIHNLVALQESVTAFSEHQQRTNEIEKNWKKTAVHSEEIEKQYKELENQEERTATAKAECEQATVLFAETERAADRNQQLLLRVTKLISVMQEVEKSKGLFLQKKDLLSKCQESVLKAKAAMETIDKKWRDSQAGMLAITLIHGESCPVCGAVDHPAPAHVQNDMPTEAEIEQQASLVTAAEQRKGSAESEYYQAESNYRANLDASAEKTTELQTLFPSIEIDKLTDYQLEYREKKVIQDRELTHLQQQKSQLTQTTEKLASLKMKKTEIKAALDRTKAEEETARIHYLEAKAKLSSLMETVPVSIRTPDGYKQALNKAELDLKVLEGALERSQMVLLQVKEQLTILLANKESAGIQLKQLEIDLTEERSRFKDEMLKQGFDSYAVYTAAKKTESALTTIKEQIKQYEEQYQRVTGRFQDLESKLKDQVKPDLLGLQKTFETIDADLETFRKLINTVRSSKQKNEQIKGKLEHILSSQKELDEKYAVIGHLHEISKGQNPFRITFERFVLAAFLDDILKEANIRLIKMTSGRYQLLRKIDPTRRNIQSGLELTVYDQYTGQERHVKTLSGGESFKAALALALGLADVVQHHAGGISLETMFIDEGFGTLDPESLDHAIETLMDIQNSGRLVGIISHVPELKERIDARLEVISSQRGSRTEFQFIG